MAGPGRPPGSTGTKKLTEASKTRIAAKLNEGYSPLEFLLECMRDEELALDIRIDCAKSAAPYCHPKLAQVEVREEKATHEQALAELA